MNIFKFSTDGSSVYYIDRTGSKSMIVDDFIKTFANSLEKMNRPNFNRDPV